MREQLLVLLGPTACGKTAVSIRLAQRLNGEVVSADSVAVYRGFAIGSARPNSEEQQGVPHHLLDCVDCDDIGFSVAKYQELAIHAIDDILFRKHLPILVGGSGLYIDAVTSPMAYVVPTNPELREALHTEYLQDPDAFLRRLGAIDPAAAERLHIHDQKRLVRAMEISILTQSPMSAQNSVYATQQQTQGRYTSRKIGLQMSREELYRRINARVDAMIRMGLIEEARAVYKLGLSRTLPAMKSIGYAQLFAHFDGLMPLTTAIEEIKRATRRFAKRQMTWFRRDPSIRWYDWERYSTVELMTETMIHDLEEEEP